MNLEGVAILSKEQQKSVNGGENPGNLITGPSKYPNKSLLYRGPLTDLNCEMTFGPGYSLSNSLYATCVHHN